MALTLLLTGVQGQLGRALQARLAHHRLHALGRDQLDLADADACRNAVLNLKPDWVLNAGAYTAVDQAEREPDQAHAVNALAPAAMAEALLALGRGRLLQISTDFVFSGAQGVPYAATPLLPHHNEALGVYGASKAQGELAVMQRLGVCTANGPQRVNS